jgi:GTPase involved in cell partitioning and DNA repair
MKTKQEMKKAEQKIADYTLTTLINSRIKAEQKIADYTLTTLINSRIC